MNTLYKDYFGPLSFYKKIAILAVPLAVQRLVASCMGIVDSLMVSWIHQVTAVGTAAQVEWLCGVVAWASAMGCGIFAAQYYGARDYQNLKKSFGLSLFLGLFVGMIWVIIAAMYGKQILSFYVSDPEVIENSWKYLQIVMFSYIPYSLNYTFSIMYRNINQPNVSLVIGIGAMILNIILNYICIFGFAGFPALGIKGAALATLIAQSASFLTILLYSCVSKQPFIGTFTEMFSLDILFIKRVLYRSFPIIFNELLFGFGSTLFIKAFGGLGTNSMEAYYIGAKIGEIFNAVVLGISDSVAVTIGNVLGTGNVDKAKKEGDFFIGMALVLSIIVGIVILITSSMLVQIFNLSSTTVMQEAVLITNIFAIKIALRLFIVIVFSSLRAGGDTYIMVFLDSGIMWVVGIPLAFISVHLFSIQSIAMVFLLCQSEQVIRLYYGLKRYHSGYWKINLTMLS